MPITALPKATIQLLGSAQTLTTPTSLIKELIDNSLDAKATSIDILISKNTLDRLEVRDNGHGIASEDFNALGKRGHTSKLRSFEQLKFIGGITLGFRGEALASAVQLGEVSVTTKTKGEAVATKLVLKAAGGVDQQTHTSHPVGTTVRVLNFMYNLPVRKKSFEKEAPKTLGRISQLLRSYALARPSIRFSLKITGGGKGSWSFAPRPNDGIRESASQVIGRDAAMECIETSLTSAKTQPKEATALHEEHDTAEPASDLNSQSEGGCFAIEAFLPKPDADLSKVGSGQYLSIDSRPVSHEKGTMKKIVALSKKYIRDALVDSSDKLKNPFLRFNIKCPIASYDANVEPAKDDVLFGNESVVLELAENLLKEVYGKSKPVPAVSAPKSFAQKLDDFELLLARNPTPTPEKPSPTSNSMPSLQKSPSSSSLTSQERSPARKESSTTGDSLVIESENNGGEHVDNGRRNWGFSMAGDFSEEVNDVHQRGRSNISLRPNPQQTPDRDMSETPLNPWIIAKMVAPVDRNPSRSEINRTLRQPISEINSPTRSQSEELVNPVSFTSTKTRPRQTFRSDDIRASQPSVRRRHSASAVRPIFDDERLNVDGDVSLRLRRRNDFVSARYVPKDALISPPPTQFPKAPARARGSNKPFGSLLTTVGNRVPPTERLIQATLFGKKPQTRRPSDGDCVMPRIEPNPDIAWAMDFEQRKADATRRLREEKRTEEMEVEFSGSSVLKRSSPHKNRYNAAIASIEAAQARVDASHDPQQTKVPFRTSFPDGDPRAYLMKRQMSLAAKKVGVGDQPMMMRAQSTRLPLERIPEEDHLHNLVFKVPTDMDKLRGAIEKLSKDDLYVRCGNHGAGLMVNAEETPVLARKLQEAVKLWMDRNEEENYEVEYAFSNLLKFKPMGA
jgi:DNA mismatch repair protein MutL